MKEESYIPQAVRDKIPDEDFGDPKKRAFPIRGQQDVDDAAHLIGKAGPGVKARIIQIAKRKGLKLPAAWQEDEQAKEAAAAPTAPKQRIARMKTYWLEDNAISLNGRKYPTEAVDRLVQSAQRQLADPDALPLTCYLSHDKADQDSTRDIVGKIAAVGREGSRAYAYIDIPDTTAGRDVVSLIAGGYIRSQSLRASGAEMRVENESAYPLVGGTNLKLEGIDFTTSPGLPQVARIAELVTESHEPQALTEIFHAHPASLILEDTTTGVTGSTADADGYAARMMPTPTMTTATPDGADTLTQVHHHLATAMGLDCAPDNMEASLKVTLQEAGAKFSAATKKHLMQAHDGVAKHLGMECADGDMPGNDGMDDGDDDDTPAESQEKEKIETMDPKELARLLQEAGYEVTPPKSQEEKLREALEARLAEERARLAEQQEEERKRLEAQRAEERKQLEEQFAEMKKMLHQVGASSAQRKTLVEGATIPTTEAVNPAVQRKRSFIQEQIQQLDPAELIDRSRPLPEWMQQNPERAISAYSDVLLGLMFDKYGYPN